MPRIGCRAGICMGCLAERLSWPMPNFRWRARFPSCAAHRRRRNSPPLRRCWGFPPSGSPISTAWPAWCGCTTRRRRSAFALVVGARLSFRDDTPDLLCYPQDRAAWGRLTRLLTVGKGRVPHGDTSDAAKATNRCFLHYADLLEHGEGQILLVVAPDRLDAGFRRQCPAPESRISAVGPISPPTGAIVAMMQAVCVRWPNCRCRWWRPTTCSITCPIGARCRT